MSKKKNQDVIFTVDKIQSFILSRQSVTYTCNKRHPYPITIYPSTIRKIGTRFTHITNK